MKLKPFIWEGTLNEEKQEKDSLNSSDWKIIEQNSGNENTKIILHRNKNKPIELSDKLDDLECVYKHFF